MKWLNLERFYKVMVKTRTGFFVCFVNSQLTRKLEHSG